MKNKLILVLLILPYLAHAQFDGIVGTEGCRAIHCEDARIIGWATSCVVKRGYQNIAKPENGMVSYGTEESATGPVNDSVATDVVSLGDGGIAVLQFDTPISDREGYDFAVFENSLNDVFLELAFVEVSSDGIHYVRFPAASYTPSNNQIGSFGSLDATRINNLAGKYRVGWGTPFDLSELVGAENLDINNINYVKIVDVIGTIDTNYASYDTAGRIINDPYPTDFASGGFDLAGVGVINNAFTAMNESNYVSYSVYPNPCTDRLTIRGEAARITLYTMMGQKMMEINKGTESIELPMQNLPSGLYIVNIRSLNHHEKIIKIIKQL